MNDNLTPLHEIGKQFQEARLHRGVVIDDVAKTLKISAKILRAIEDGDRESLPQLVFLRGFIKSYGESLGFSKTDLQKTLTYLEESEPKTDLTPRAPEKSTYMSDTPYVSKKMMRQRAIITSLIALLVLVFAYALYTFLFTPIEKSEEITEISQVADEAQVKALSNSLLSSLNKVKAVDQLDKAKELQAQRKEEEIEALAKQIASDLEQDSLNNEAIAEEAEVKPEPEIEISVPITPSEEVKDVVPAFVDDDELARMKEESEIPEYERVSSFGNGRRTLLITASQECWISFELDYREAREVYLAPGQEVFVRFDTEANLRVGNAGGVNVTYNGQDLGAPGRVGQVRRLTYPYRQASN